MYERFTERSRSIVQAANSAAQRLGHEYIGVEHILLGLLETSDCVAVQVLKLLELDTRKLELDLEKLVPANPGTKSTARLPQTPGAKRVIELSMLECRRLDSGFVGSEHLLLGLLAEGGIAGQVLTNLGVKAADVVEEIPHALSKWPLGRDRSS